MCICVLKRRNRDGLLPNKSTVFWQEVSGLAFFIA
uniref:Uncharacterized protein n=1 Tax=Anguilla anguilla TaxID=7936 RepID=A0A0E9P5N6_ANGAN